MGWALDKTLNERYFFQQLPCGMPVYIMPKDGFRQKYAVWHIHLGALHQSLSPVNKEISVTLPAGLAHFMEHRLFEKKCGDISERFAEYGADINAYTSYTHTACFFSATDDFSTNLELLKETVLVPYFNEDAIQREREIIAREIRLFHDSYEWVGEYGAIKALYGKQPISIDIAGTEDSLEAITPEILTAAHLDYYQPTNMSLFIGGDLDAEALLGEIEEWQELKVLSSGSQPKSINPQIPVANRAAQFKKSMPIAMPRVYLGFSEHETGTYGKALLTRELALDLLLDILFSPSSEFFQKNYQRGLIEAESFGWDVQLEQEYGFVLIGGDSPNPDRLVAEILEELANARTNGQLEAGFVRTKHKAYGHMVERFEQVESAVESMRRCVISGAKPFDIYAITRDISLNDVRTCLFTCLDPEQYVISLVYPE